MHAKVDLSTWEGLDGRCVSLLMWHLVVDLLIQARSDLNNLCSRQVQIIMPRYGKTLDLKKSAGGTRSTFPATMHVPPTSSELFPARSPFCALGDFSSQGLLEEVCVKAERPLAVLAEPTKV